MTTLGQCRKELATALARRAATLDIERIASSPYQNDATYRYSILSSAREVVHIEDVRYKSWQAAIDGEHLDQPDVYRGNHKTGGQALSACVRLLKKALELPEDVSACATLDAAAAKALRENYAKSTATALAGCDSARRVQRMAEGAGLTVPDILTEDAVAELLAALNANYPDVIVELHAWGVQPNDLATILHNRAAATANLIATANQADAELVEAMRRVEQLKAAAAKARRATESLTKAEASDW